MRSTRALVALVALTVSSTASASEPKVWSEKVAGSEIPFSVGEITIAAPAEVLWQIVSRCGDYKKTMVRIAASKELSRTGDALSFVTRCEVTADLPFPLSDLTSINKAEHTVEPGKKYLRKWALESGDYDINEGSWTLLVVDEKTTKALYRLRVKPKLPVPDGMLAGLQKDTLPKLLTNLRDRGEAAAKTSTVSAPPPATP
jgi:hypothetical protein